MGKMFKKGLVEKICVCQPVNVSTSYLADTISE
jgi:hypothetical protein